MIVKPATFAEVPSACIRWQNTVEPLVVFRFKVRTSETLIEIAATRLILNRIAPNQGLLCHPLRMVAG